jgi:probable rRNA maturation factor
MKIEFFNFHLLKDFDIPKGKLRSILEQLFDLKISVNIIFLTEVEITQLNVQFRNIDKPTDVLTFGPYDDTAEIYICPNFIQQKTQDFEKELVRVLIHGILHLQGYDHEGYFDENKIVEEMYVLQEEYLKRFYDIFKDK